MRRPDVVAVVSQGGLLGHVLTAWDGEALVAVSLGADAAAAEADLVRRWPGVDRVPADRDLSALVAWLDDPVGPWTGPVRLVGTPFQQQVWTALQGVPAGETVTYAQLAARLGRPTASRAVASAVAANPLAVVVPCHRVVRSDGGLGEYRWGVDRKRALLRREARGAPVLRAP